MLFVLAILITLAVLAPVLGADSRDGLDWAPNHFWRRRRSVKRVKRTDSHGPASAGLCAADGGRTAPAAW
jgi:hypothetical protein